MNALGMGGHGRPDILLKLNKSDVEEFVTQARTRIDTKFQPSRLSLTENLSMAKRGSRGNHLAVRHRDSNLTEIALRLH